MFDTLSLKKLRELRREIHRLKSNQFEDSEILNNIESVALTIKEVIIELHKEALDDPNIYSGLFQVCIALTRDIENIKTNPSKIKSLEKEVLSLERNIEILVNTSVRRLKQLRAGIKHSTTKRCAQTIISIARDTLSEQNIRKIQENIRLLILTLEPDIEGVSNEHRQKFNKSLANLRRNLIGVPNTIFDNDSTFFYVKPDVKFIQQIKGLSKVGNNQTEYRVTFKEYFTLLNTCSTIDEYLNQVLLFLSCVYDIYIRLITLSKGFGDYIQLKIINNFDAFLSDPDSLVVHYYNLNNSQIIRKNIDQIAVEKGLRLVREDRAEKGFDFNHADIEKSMSHTTIISKLVCNAFLKEYALKIQQAEVSDVATFLKSQIIFFRNVSPEYAFDLLHK